MQLIANIESKTKRRSRFEGSISPTLDSVIITRETLAKDRSEVFTIMRNVIRVALLENHLCMVFVLETVLLRPAGPDGKWVRNG